MDNSLSTRKIEMKQKLLHTHTYTHTHDLSHNMTKWVESKSQIYPRMRTRRLNSNLLVLCMSQNLVDDNMPTTNRA